MAPGSKMTLRSAASCKQRLQWRFPRSHTISFNSKCANNLIISITPQTIWVFCIYDCPKNDIWLCGLKHIVSLYYKGTWVLLCIITKSWYPCPYWELEAKHLRIDWRSPVKMWRFQPKYGTILTCVRQQGMSNERMYAQDILYCPYMIRYALYFM